MFGFDQGEVVAGGTSHDSENASALSSALLVCLIVPWGLCFVFYFGEAFTKSSSSLSSSEKTALLNFLCLKGWGYNMLFDYHQSRLTLSAVQ